MLKIHTHINTWPKQPLSKIINKANTTTENFKNAASQNKQNETKSHTNPL